MIVSLMIDGKKVMATENHYICVGGAFLQAKELHECTKSKDCQCEECIEARSDDDHDDWVMED